MSWDIFIQDFPSSAQSVAEIPDDFRPRAIGSRTEMIARICRVFPEADFQDPAWGVLQADAFSIEFNMGSEERLLSFALHVRGDAVAADAVSQLLDALELRAIDSGIGDFFTRDRAHESMAEWSAYRDRVVDESS